MLPSGRRQTLGYFLPGDICGSSVIALTARTILRRRSIENGINVAQRTALERLTHLFCEVRLRMAAVNEATPLGGNLPVSCLN